jgi:hypothetical protein
MLGVVCHAAGLRRAQAGWPELGGVEPPRLESPTLELPGLELPGLESRSKKFPATRNQRFTESNLLGEKAA